MEIKGYHIILLEAKDIYKQELKNGVEKGYVLPSKNDRVYFGLFKNVLDYSLDLIEIEKCYQKKYRNNKFFFEDEYKNKYTLTIINLKFTYTYKDENNEKDLKQLREHFYNNGFNLGGVHYVRYKRSSGSSRQGKCLFIDEKLLKAMEKWGECGLKPTGDLASWESYKSLSLSSLKGTIDIPLNGILFIQDCKSEFFEEVVSVEEKDGVLVATTKETTIENDIWDGESLLDKSLFSGNYTDKHMLLLRNKFFKSCAFRTKLQKWFKDKNITLDDLKARGFITLATDIIQSGTLVLWTMAGCLDRFPKVYNSRYFSEIICLALVTDEDSLRQRMQEGRGITDENWIDSSCDYNRYFMEHTQVGDTKYELLDISMKSPKEVADDVINWVHGKVFV